MKWFHLIGVCGKTTANIAKVFQDEGWFVTGSDTQFLPPASNLLKEYKINTVDDYSFKHLTKEFWVEKLKEESNEIELEKVKAVESENPDLVLFISYLSSKNKEYLFAKKKNLKILPYAQILKEYMIKDESIVVVGTAGKTTTTALITFILQRLGINPSYMIGAEVVNIADSLKFTDSKFSVTEGDEYHNPDPEIEGHAKFLEYKPKYLVITNIGWEHQDIFPSQEKYIEEFSKVVAEVPENGFIVAHDGDENIEKTLKNAKCKIIKYRFKSEKDPKQQNIWEIEKLDNSTNRIYNNGEPVLDFESSLLGDYNLENVLAAVCVILNLPASTLPVELTSRGSQSLVDISNIIKSFKGAKKRLEILHKSEDLIVIDDFGVAPNRAANSLDTLKKNFPEYKIIAAFEPNSGSRPMNEDLFNSMYKNSFKNADEIIIPDLSIANAELVSTEELIKRFNSHGFETKHIANENLVDELMKLKNNSKEKLLIVFFSSYRLTETAEEFVKLIASD